MNLSNLEENNNWKRSINTGILLFLGKERKDEKRLQTIAKENFRKRFDFK